VQDFTVTTTPLSVSFTSGGSSSFSVTASSVHGFAGTITFAYASSPTPLPNGFSGSWLSGTNFCTLSAGTKCSATFNVAATNSYTGTVTLTFNGTYAPSPVNIKYSKPAVTVVVTAAAPLTGGPCTIIPDPALIGSLVTFDANPGGGTGSYTCDWSSGPGVTMSDTFAFNSAGHGCTRTYTPGSSNGGPWTPQVVVHDSGGSSLPIITCPSYVVQDYSISAAPSTTSVLPGQTKWYTVTASSIHGFAGDILIDQSTALPSGISETWAGCDGTKPTCTCTVPAGGTCSISYGTAVASTFTGPWADTTLNFIGSYPPIPGLSRPATAILGLWDYTVTVTVDPPNLAAGSSATGTVHIAPVSGYNQDVDLSALTPLTTMNIPGEVRSFTVSIHPYNLTPLGMYSTVPQFIAPVMAPIRLPAP
jgi:hypothetical protein